ncbi:MAG: TetR/AcrR family transcriptional regulator [Acidobacteria bacterium]|nr:TetR/AcrR family transcriptional regulator [Acidobacteriota bacterium]
MAQFVKQGIYTTRVEDITDGADVAKGAFYNYFASKADLVAELLLQGIRLLDETYLRPAARRRNAPGNRVRDFVERHEAFLSEHPEYALLFHQSRGMLLLEPDASPKLNEAFRRYLECIVSKLGDGAEAGAGEEEALQHAAALAGLIAGHRSFAAAAGLSADQRLTLELAVRGFSKTAEDRPIAKGVTPPLPTRHD